MDDPDKMFFEYLARAYESFLQGNDDDEQLENELAQAFESKNQSTREEVDRVGAANANPFVNSSAAAAPSSPLGPPDIEPDVGVISCEFAHTHLCLPVERDAHAGLEHGV